MTLKSLVASKAKELMDLLDRCEDGDFIDEVVNAVKYFDYAAIGDLEQEDGHGQTD